MFNEQQNKLLRIYILQEMRGEEYVIDFQLLDYLMDIQHRYNLVAPLFFQFGPKYHINTENQLFSHLINRG